MEQHCACQAAGQGGKPQWTVENRGGMFIYDMGSDSDPDELYTPPGGENSPTRKAQRAEEKKRRRKEEQRKKEEQVAMIGRGVAAIKVGGEQGKAE